MKPLSFFLYAAGCAVVVGMMILTPCATSIHAPAASLNIYDLSSGQKLTALRGHNRPTTAIAVSPDGTVALTASSTPELRWWSLDDHREMGTIELWRGQPRAGPGPYLGPGYTLHFLDGTNLALISHEDAGLGLWNLESGTRIRTFDAPFREAQAVAVSRDQTTATATGSRGVVAVSWRLADGERRGVFTEEWLENSPWVTLARDGQPRSWWNSDTGERREEGKPAPDGTRVPTRHQATLSPDGQRLLTYYGGLEHQAEPHRFRVWDLESGGLLCQRSGLTLPIIQGRSRSGCEAFAFSPDGRTLAVGMIEGRIEIREVEGGRLTRELVAPPRSCDRVVFLPDGKRLLTWGDGWVRLWEVETGKEVRSFTVPVLYCLAFTPDSRLLLVGGTSEFSGL